MSSTQAPPPPEGSPASRLDAARRRIDALDGELVRVAAERVAAAAEAGQAKAEMGQSLIDYQRERRVLEQVREAAVRHGLEPGVAEDLVTRLIVASTSRQELQRVAASRSGAGRTAVVVGGAGRMGRWLVRFLQGAGHRALVLDPAQPAGAEEAQARLADADLVLLAVPPSEAARLYDAWASKPPRGVVADLCSVKAPLVPALRRFAAAGGRAASFHPMFGPSATMLRGADVVLCDTGDAQAGSAVRALFESTSARLVDVGLEEHDRLMAEVLSLAHATAIAFAASLPAEPLAAHSTTFRRLRDVAASVVEESPQVYFEIQAGNPHSLAALGRLQDSLERLKATVAGGDPEAFRGLLEEGRRRVAASAPGATLAAARPEAAA
jgi:chorismate mutase/prephenate dehydrogenase